MTIPSATIIDLATPTSDCDSPDRVRSRLEWTWGLGHDHLDQHLQEFNDPQSILTDETVLVLPHNDIIRQFVSRNIAGKLGVCRLHIQKLYNGDKNFEYIVVPTDADSTLPARILHSELPPHLALCTTYGKMLKAWGKLPRQAWNANLVSVVERANAMPHTGRPALGMSQLTLMDTIHSNWTWSDYVPPSFLSADSDQTMVEPEEGHPGNAKRKSTSSGSQASSSSGSPHEPKRRLLPSEFESPPAFDVECDADEDDDNDAISHDSYISGIEGDPEEFAKASVARDDYEVDPRWLKGIRRWANRASSADGDETLLNDEQIPDDPRERPRDAASLDLGKPDYLLRDTSRMAI